MKINLIEFNETSRRVSVFVDVPIFILFKERKFAFAAYDIPTHRVGNNDRELFMKQWFWSDTKLPVPSEIAVYLDNFARGCATAKGLIN